MAVAIAVSVVLWLGLVAGAPSKRPDPSLAFQQGLARQIAASLPGMDRVRLVVGLAPHDMAGISDSRHWVRAWIRARSFKYLKLEWQSVLVAALTRDFAARAHQAPPIAGISLWRIQPQDGRAIEDSGFTLGHPFQTHVKRISDAGLRWRVLRVAKKAKIEVVSLTLRKLLDRTALELTVKASHFGPVALFQLQRPCGGVPAGCEGEFIRVIDAHGKVVEASAFSVRTGIGIGIGGPPASAEAVGQRTDR